MAADISPKHEVFGYSRALLSARGGRLRVYIAIAIFLAIVAVASRGYESWRRHETLNFVFSDARGQYVYLPSLIVDGDLDFMNQMLATWGAELNGWDINLNDRTERGVIPNKYLSGLALSIAPAFLVGHGVAWLGTLAGGGSWFAMDGYSPPYQLLCLMQVMGMSLLTMVMIDRLLETSFRLDGRVIGWAVIAFWLGSHYLWYCVREPFMVHVISGFWVTTVVHLCVRIRRAATEGRVSGWDIFLLSFAMSMALVTRPSNVFIAPMLLWMFAGLIRAGMGRKFAALLPASIPGLLPLGIQLLVWHQMTGHWFNYGYRDEGFVWTHPALWQTVFSLRKGLFIWTPLLVLSMGGIILFLLRPAAQQRSFVGCWLLCAGLLWYVNSSWWAWGFGWSFGARAFLELVGLFILGLAFLFQWAVRNPGLASRVVVGMTAVTIVYCHVLMFLYQFDVVPRVGGWHADAVPPRAERQVLHASGGGE